MKIITITLLCSIFFLISCTDPNPLIGTWKVKPGQKSLMASVCTEIRFEDELSTCDGLAEKVTYEVRDGEVFVHGISGLSAIYKVHDRNTISFKMPALGEVKFNRASY